MANDERKLATSSLIPLEIDPVSILSLSKGVIFDTIVHNIEYTLSNRLTDPLPWKLVGMSLICDASRNKKYMQKLQKMQCVPSVICTQIYHSKLVKTESNILATPGRKIVLPTLPRTRLTGIIVCRSIDELLYMESSNSTNVHFIQYKLLSYERIATREIVNGPKLTSVGDKIIKTVFDFELTQNNGFPRQLLPVAIISFTRQDGCDLCLSIRNFLNLDEHKIFDKSYLVTSINVEFDRLREEQEKKEDAEIEQELLSEKVQRRQPLADLSKKSTDTGNARPLSISSPSPPPLRVAPIKIKLPGSEKPVKPSVCKTSIDSKFRCLVKLDRVDLSTYDISNLPDPLQLKIKISNEYSTLPILTNNKTKSLTITKPYEHKKSLKRLKNSEIKNQSSLSSEISKQKRNNNSSSIHLSTSDVDISSVKNKQNRRSISSSTMSPIYRPNPTVQKQQVEKITKKKVNRPILPSEYKCSLPLTRIDLSIYNLDLPPIPASIKTLSMDILTSSPSTSTSSEQQIDIRNVLVEPETVSNPIQSVCTVEQENIHEHEIENIFVTEQFMDTNTQEILSNIVEEFSTPDLNELESNNSNDILPLSTNEILSKTIDESPSIQINEVLPTPTKKIVSEVINDVITEATNELLSTTKNNEIPIEVNNEGMLPTTNEIVATNSSEEMIKSISTSPAPFVTFSPDLPPPFDDDPVLFSIRSPPIPPTDTSDIIPQDYIIIVPCSDEEDDINDDDLTNDIKKSLNTNNIDTKIIVESSSSLPEKTISSTLLNPSSTQILTNINPLKSNRLSTSSLSSSCSSISTSILLNQSPGLPLSLTKIFLSQKILNKNQRKTTETICFNQYNISIPLFSQESLIDPRLIYRLQSITTDLRWPSPCTQCSISPYLPSLFTSSTQTILYDRKSPLDFVDPRRESLKNAILNHIYQRIKMLIPNIFVINSNQFQKVLFEQTIFKTNCSLHLEYLLHKLKMTDDINFFQMIKTTEEFQLSTILLQLIFN